MRARRLLLAAAVAGAPLLQVAGMVPHPELGATAADSLALVAEDPAGWFQMHALASGAAMLSIVASLALASLVRGRGAVLATVGATAAALGGAALAFAFAAEAHLWSLAADPSVDPAAGAAVAALEEGSPAMTFLMAGFPLSGIGSLLLMSALVRSRVVPRWQPLLVVMGTVTSIAAPPGSDLGPVLFLPSVLGMLLLARAVARPQPAPAEQLVLAA